MFFSLVKRYWYVPAIAAVIITIALVSYYFPAFRDFVFIGMFKEDQNWASKFFGIERIKAPSLINAVVIPLGGLAGIVLLYIRTRATDRQAKTAHDTLEQIQIAHEFEITQTYEDQFNRAVDYLSPNKDPTLWRSGLSTIRVLTMRMPERFYYDAISTLINAGQVFSQQITPNPFDTNPDLSEHSDEVVKKFDPQRRPKKFIQTDFDHSEFVFEILKTIVSINNADSSSDFYKLQSSRQNKIVIQGFRISIHNPSITTSTNWKSLQDYDFEHFSFEQCNLREIEFYQSDLSKTLFIETIGMNFNSCLVSGVTLLNIDQPTKNNIQQVPNTFEPNFNVFLWSDDVVGYQVAVKHIMNFERLDAEKFKETWETINFPRVPKQHVYEEWMVE